MVTLNSQEIENRTWHIPQAPTLPHTQGQNHWRMCVSMAVISNTFWSNRRVVFIFMLQLKTAKRGEKCSIMSVTENIRASWDLLCPEYHCKIQKKERKPTLPILYGHFELKQALNFHLSLFKTFPLFGLSQSGAYSPLPVSLSMNHAFVVFPPFSHHTHPPRSIFNTGPSDKPREVTDNVKLLLTGPQN